MIEPAPGTGECGVSEDRDIVISNPLSIQSIAYNKDKDYLIYTLNNDNGLHYQDCIEHIFDLLKY